MGTRSITVVKDENGKKIIEMYKQFDGYPEGLGKELVEFIQSGKIVNGLSMNETEKVFNSIHCFAAQLVAHFKIGAGEIYLYPPSSNSRNKIKYYDEYFAEYYYEIDAKLNIKCWDTYKNKIVDIPND